ncbi:hypothetical protein ABFT23_00120 [Nocardioides sp. C4-1]|uniref:hypothetical protein n=1 Tax=Nocardioides sp. C4-1 TaxID=3151851 RepID=UPI0032648F5F
MLTSRNRGERGFATTSYVGAILVASLLAVAVTSQYAPAAQRLARAFVCAIESVVAQGTGGTAYCRDDEGDGPNDGGGPTPTDPDQPPIDPDNPDNPECKDAIPTSGELDVDAPTLVQVGCKVLYVPEGCEEEWEAYVDATIGDDRADAAGPLAECVRERYETMEPPCITSQTSEVSKSELQILFIKISNSDGFVVEKLGDGRVRAHLLKGAEVGGGVSGTLSNISFDLAGVTGYENDKTYEFENMESAQAWLDWYKKVRLNSELIGPWGPPVIPCPNCPPSQNAQNERMKAAQRLQELKKNEPPHHILSEATTKTSKITLKGGYSFPITKGGDNGGAQGAATPSIEGNYTGETQVEQRVGTDGSRVVTAKSSDAGGFLLGLKLGGKGLGKKDDKGKQEGGGAGGGFQFGADWQGSTATTVAWNPEGELSKVIFTMDDQVMKTLAKAGIDVSVMLPRGFGASFTYSQEQKEGKSNVTEMILDFEQHPELRETLGPVIDELFPRNDEGELEGGNIDIGFDDTGAQETLQDAVDENSNVRRLEYDIDEETTSFGTSIDLMGIDLFKASFTEVETVKELNGSELEITDVNGDTQVVTPAPKCKDEAFVAPDGYWQTGWSDPPTPSPVP